MSSLPKGETKAKDDKNRVRFLNTIFNDYHIDKVHYYNSQCKEIEENKRKGKKSDLYQSIQEVKGNSNLD